jgi:23S rRNA pseudouridine955/2504/2580 synthase
MTYLPSFFSKQFGGDVPKIVHRLDKETSGLLVVARHRLAAARFSAILREGLVKKTYQVFTLCI